MKDGNVVENTDAAASEKRVKEKSSYKKLIAQIQTSYPQISQDQALRGILVLRAKNGGTLSGMTMIDIMEGAISIIGPEKTRDDGNESEDDVDEETKATFVKDTSAIQKDDEPVLTDESEGTVTQVYEKYK